ncbi:hypothetical protein HJC23_007040 [Cyclotella cryptica]|uniref:AP2/ERF domain-containing protein n=1 Tax=Cyclotella cryptica TaxID=29204 RepID=A0ABD3NY86_9STRA|eukprot:CCRYP_019185-RB/>CCRYP_019185-RB protein AED:0.18 eAED:0.18 QI:355/0.66/0.75/1/0.33/0/4/1652/688
MVDSADPSNALPEAAPRQRPSSSPRSTPLHTANGITYHPPPPPANCYAPYAPPPPMGSPSHHGPGGGPHGPSSYPMYQQYPPMNGPPHPHLPTNYPPSQNQGHRSPSQSGAAEPPPTHFGMYHQLPPYHPNGMPPPQNYPMPPGHSNWNSSLYPGGPDGSYGWGAPPPPHAPIGNDGNGGEHPADDVRDGSHVKNEERAEGDEREPKGDSPESANRHENEHHLQHPPGYYAHYPPYGNPPPAYQNHNPDEAPPISSLYPPANYPGHQYGPPPSFGHHPPPQPYHYPNDMNSYPPYPGHPSMHGYPPYVSQELQSPWEEADKKRHRATPTSEVPYPAYPPIKRSIPNPEPGVGWASKRTIASQFPTSKSVRRKKKMYSDYVGVTYNKTHAKYQACITHYRKQHYLGRYKLAVDAALAYDESARLLKGTSWKVNFQTREAYEEAKMRELESIGAIGQRTIDLEKSMATVASKVEEIASKAGSSDVQSLVVRPSSRMLNAPYASFTNNETAYAASEVGDDSSKSKHTPFPQTSQTANDSPSMTKVTPSPTGLVASPHHEQQKQTSTDFKDSKTPLPETPNPTRHAMGTESSTPDSVIRPTVLSYLSKDGDLIEVDSSSKKSPDVPYDKKANPAAVRQLRARQSPKSASKLPSTPKANVLQRTALTSPRPVIQNGTLAAASALMTLTKRHQS